jgi:hypothetical protein
MFHDSSSKNPDQFDPPKKPKRRWLRFSVRAMMAMVLITGVLLSWPIKRANVQRRAVAALRKADSRAYLAYDFEYSADGRVRPNASPWAPAWLRRLIGDEFFQEVDTVSLQGPVTDATMATLEGLQWLRILHLRDSSRIGDGLVHLRGMRNLERLHLCGPAITDAGLVNLRDLAKLRHLDLEATSVTDAGLAHLSVLNELKAIRIHDRGGRAARLSGSVVTRVTDAGLMHLARLHRLRLLEISTAPGVTDLAPLDPQRNLPELIFLNLHDTGVTDAGLAPIEGIAALVSLDLRSTWVTDAGLAHLRGLSNLKQLYLDRTKVSDAGLAHLSYLTNLRLSSIGYTEVSDAGLVHLKGLLNLKDLWLPQSGVTDAGVKQALPKVSIGR